MKALRLGLGCLTAFVFLNALLSHHNIWPTPWVRLAPELSVEILVLLLVLALWCEFWDRWPRRTIPWLTILIAALAVGRYADVTAPALFGRPINLYWDVQHVPNVTAMLIEAAPWWQTAGTILFTVLLTFLLILAIRLSLRAVLNSFQRNALRRLIGGAAAGLIVIYASGMKNDQLDWERWFSIPVTPVYAKQVAFLIKAKPARASTGHKLQPSNLARIKGRDVFLIFLESYGATAIRDPRHAGLLEPSFAAIEDFLAGSDWQAVSTMVQSPTHGGASWLAHASLLSGRWISQQDDYHLFLAHPSETLIDRFRTAGYRTLALMPGIKRDWPEGKGYGFDDILDARFLDYRGPAFGWWTIPDQYSLERLIQTEVTPQNRKPVFAFFPTIMSHMPFGPTPPYQPDWGKLATSSPFVGTPVGAALAAQPDLSNLSPAYVQTMQHNLQMLRGFLAERAPVGSLVIVAGDHQPSAIISGPDAPWHAPFHVFSTDRKLLNGLHAEGFIPGIRPPVDATLRMHELNGALLRALHKDETSAQMPVKRTVLQQ